MPDRNINIAALVSYQVYPVKMGGQKGIAFFYRYLSKTRPLIIIGTTDNEFPGEPGVTFLPLLGRSRFRYINPLLFFPIRKLIRQQKISHLILEHPYYGWLGVLLKWTTGVKLVIHSHNIEAARFKSIGKWWWGILWNYEKFTHRRADINFFIHDDDRDTAIRQFKLNPEKCTTITYGIEMAQAPSAADRLADRKTICSTHYIDEQDSILLFNGSLNYGPNLAALDIILKQINPLLLKRPSFHYKIIICGNKLPAGYDNLSAYRDKNIIYAGFVDDIGVYFNGADIFLNPVTDGGGIKTKVVEALGHDLSVISTPGGATGIPVTITGDKLKLADENDWEKFVSQIDRVKKDDHIPDSFFTHFYWGHIAAKANKKIEEVQ